MGIRCGINNVRDLYIILKDMMETGKENYVICVKCGNWHAIFKG